MAASRSSLFRRAMSVVRKDRGLALRASRAALRGVWLSAKYRLGSRKVRIALPFFAYADVRIVGPGRVQIGRFCSVFTNTFVGLSIVTLAPESVVEIGAKCSLGGLTIVCRDRVRIGPRSMTAFSLVQDVLFSDTESAVGRNANAIAIGAIEIGSNVWLGGLSCALAGSRLGDDSVLSWGAVCLGANVPSSALASGNPVQRAVPIERVLALMKGSNADSPG